MAKEKQKSPAYQWYPKDYMTDTRVMLMDIATQGAYRMALDICWLHGGEITADPRELSMLIGKGCKIKHAEAVIAMFTVSEDGKTMRNKRLDVERDLAETRKLLAQESALHASEALSIGQQSLNALQTANKSTQRWQELNYELSEKLAAVFRYS